MKALQLRESHDHRSIDGHSRPTPAVAAACICTMREKPAESNLIDPEHIPVCIE